MKKYSVFCQNTQLKILNIYLSTRTLRPRLRKVRSAFNQDWSLLWVCKIDVLLTLDASIHTQMNDWFFIWFSLQSREYRLPWTFFIRKFYISLFISLNINTIIWIRSSLWWVEKEEKKRDLYSVKNRLEVLCWYNILWPIDDDPWSN